MNTATNDTVIDRMVKPISPQGNVVDRVAQEMHGAESRDDRDRHSHARDRSSAQAAQEQVDHEDHQPHGEQQGHLDVVNGSAHRCRAVVEHVDAA